MNNSLSLRLFGRHRQRRWWLAIVLSMVVGSVLLARATPSALAANNVGTKDFSYTGTTAPTGQKPQSKLWFNDGLWWGSLFNRSTGKFDIYRFNWTTSTWTDTSVVIDERPLSSADMMWDGSHLYAASAVPPGTGGDVSIRLLRYSYNASTKTYSLDSGFPVTVINAAVEVVVFDKDTTGKIWITYTNTNSSGGRNVYVTHTTTNEQTFITPYVIPTTGATTLTSDDISAVVQFNSQIGVMWSNQNDSTMYFAIHQDGAADTAWTLNPALQGPHYADDHINLKSLQADPSGQVFAAVKTSLNDVNPATSTQPLILLLTLGQNGSWSRTTFGRVVDDHTRPIVLIDSEHRNVYMFATAPGSQGGGAIYYKQSSLDQVSFPDGVGTPFIQSNTDFKINNASSTKQNLSSATGLLVVAGDDSTSYYFHNTLDLGPASPTATPTDTPATSSTPTNTPTATATNTPTPTPTYTPTPGSVITFGASADAHVDEASSTTNYGTATVIRTDGGTGVNVESYLRFDVSGLTGPLQSATLRLYASTGTVDGPAVYATSNTWTETGITWSTRPGRTSSAVDDKGAIASNTWVEFNVTPLVSGDGTYSFDLAQAVTNTDGLDFSSREGSFPPQLVLTMAAGPTATPTDTPTPTPTVTSTPTATPTNTPTPTSTDTPTPTPTPTDTPTPVGV